MSEKVGEELGPSPRLCHLIKWPDFDGYGFNLHAEKAKSGQYIGKVDPDSPAELAGLQEGDRIIEVNLVNIANENHRQVVERIKSIPNETKLLVIDDTSDKWYKEHKIVVKSTQSNVMHYKTPVPRPVKHELNTIDTNGSDDNTNGVSNGDNDNHSTTESIGSKHNEVDVNHKTNGLANIGDQSPVVENGGQSSASSTPKSTKRSQESQQQNQPISPSSTGSNTNVSIPDSPISSKSGSSGLSGPSRQLSESSTLDLNLNMSASEMRQLLAQRKKLDAKKAQMDLKQKYEIIQQM
ncbi:Na(+)/H(+) exchange regulatory cofactor NHE-RF1-like [Oppia nitens]|uniref:Na(+)/H(+) exchange regulatory cofactor NHE-RF1-like n=1 Tax=Oppia nitens TaxID=1686743 RepID=UPI0023DBC890|nr:Na(+)/H(+) exchange regulatory cofactor NHE-RF1-like [Oppia nitens]XP_054161546.1 Na(+)/H(+) exchange regulatory cofactor NHE-RF1-like [Oppia nitens]XP_054161547.1 Na(+)/H(+) exchange regulatory cofactor NHE-RF1-like [Oppia nitens]